MPGTQTNPDLVIVVVMQLNGTCRALCSTGAATLTPGGVDPRCTAQFADSTQIVSHFWNAEGAGSDASKASGAFRIVDFGDHAAQVEDRTAEKGHRSASTSKRMGNAFLDKLRVMRHTAKVDTFVMELHGAHFKMRLKEETLRR